MTVVGRPRRLALRQMTTNLLRATDGRDVLLNSPDGWEVEQPWLYWLGPGNGATGPVRSSDPRRQRRQRVRLDPRSRPSVEPDRRHDRHPAVAHVPGGDGTVDDPRLDHRPASPTPRRACRRPDQRRTRPACPTSTIWGQWILSALWFGDGFAYVPTRDEQGAPKPPLWLLNPADVELRDGGYWVADERMNPGTIIHLRGQLPIVDGRGTGVLARFAADLGINMSLRSYMAGAFTAGVPAGYLKALTPNLSQDQADALKARWMSQHGGRRSIAVLNATTEFHPLTWSPVELAAADFARITLGQIALMFGLPAYMLGAPTDSSARMPTSSPATSNCTSSRCCRGSAASNPCCPPRCPGARRCGSRSTGSCGPTRKPGTRRMPSPSTKGS